MAVEKFETALKKLEEVVRRLESGELPLEESLKAFEEGVRQANFCTRKLNEAESAWRCSSSRRTAVSRERNSGRRIERPQGIFCPRNTRTTRT